MSRIRPVKNAMKWYRVLNWKSLGQWRVYSLNRAWFQTIPGTVTCCINHSLVLPMPSRERTSKININQTLAIPRR